MTPPVRIRKQRTSRLDEQIRRAVRVSPADSNRGFSSFAQSGPLGGEQPDPPGTPDDAGAVIYSVTVVNNSTGDLDLSPTSAHRGVKLICYWERSTSKGVAECVGWHDGSTVSFYPFSGNPGWNPGGFTGSISGSDLTFTFAADNSGSNINMQVVVIRLPEI